MFSVFTLFAILSFVLDAAHAAPVRRASSNDILVFQFAAVLERLESAFYTQALQKFQSSDFAAAGFADVNVPEQIFAGIARDEATHDSVLEAQLVALGGQPITTCSFDFGDALNDVISMAATARIVENVGVSAFLGGASLLDDVELLVAAATILTIEARHQSLLNILNAATAIPSSFDVALSPSQVLAIAGGFITGCNLGIPANPSLTITTPGPLQAKTPLSFSSSGIPSNTAGVTCQFIAGGDSIATAFPIEDCVVPVNINGPVYIYIVNTTQPLLNDLTTQFAASIIAGPTLAFIDSQTEDLGEVARDGSVSGSGAGDAGQSGDIATATTTTITPAQATTLANAANALVSSENSSNNTLSTNTTLSTNPTTNGTDIAAPGGSATNSTSAITVLGWSNDTSTST